MRALPSRLLVVAIAVLLSACGGTEDVDEYELGNPGDDPLVDETDPEGPETLGTDPDAFEGEELTDADPSGDDALDPELVDTIAGEDGTGHQVTYNGQPLYYYVDDQEVGDVEGQGRNDQWFVIDAQGEPIRGDG